jgi:seryl-tRNA synthetase
MIDIHAIRKDPDAVARGAKAKGVDIDVKKIVQLDAKYRATLQKREALRAKKNDANASIAKAKGAEKKKRIAEMRNVDADEQKVVPTLQKMERTLREMLMHIPNMPASDVTVGVDDSHNDVLRTVGKKPTFDFEPRDSLALGELHEFIDVKRAANVAGARFGYIKGDLALLEFALLEHAVKTLSGHGFTPVIPPVLVRDAMMEGMGFLEHGDDQETYHLDKDGLYLVGTSEQSLGPMHVGETLEKGALPRRYFAYTPCFRREAGAYGKDTRGVLRVHQYSKMEMLSLVPPDASDKEHAWFLELEEQLMADLKLHYRTVRLCSGDLGTPSARTYDIEAWLPSEERFRETHSTSTTTDFQSRRLNIRYRSGDGAPQFVHIVNGTYFAERLLLVIMEQYQRSDGTIAVPKLLQSAMGKKIIGKK